MKKRILALLAAGTMLLTGCGAQNAARLKRQTAAAMICST